MTDRRDLGETPEWLERDRDAAAIRETTTLYIVGKRKYNYFIMGFAITSIAFSVQQTSGSTWDENSIYWGWAIGLWLVSIFCGLRCEHVIHYRIEMLLTDFNKYYKDAFPILYRVLRWIQHTTLVGGVGFFLYWHIQKMINAC